MLFVVVSMIVAKFSFDFGYKKGLGGADYYLNQLGVPESALQGVPARQFSGTVKSVDVDKNSLIVQTATFSRDSQQSDRFVLIGKETAIVVSTLDYEKLGQTNSDGTPVNPFSEREVDVSDLREGDLVIVYTENDASNSVNTLATKIVINKN